MGRKCCVPHCYTGYATCKEKKASMFRVPEEQHLLDKWQEAIARADRPVTSKDNVCEKHFTENDIVRWRIVNGVNEEYKIPKLRSDAVPSIFPAQPEYIKKMVKKQRKLDDPNEPSIEHSSEPETSHIEMEIKIEPIEEEEHYNDLSLSETEIQIKTEIEDTEIKTEDETYKYQNSPMTCTPSDLKEEIVPQSPLSSSQPRNISEFAYERFIKWTKEQNAYDYSENVVLAYFNHVAQKMKTSALLAQYSMIKTELKIKLNVDIETYDKLNDFMKIQCKGFRPKKPGVFNKKQFDAFLRSASNSTYLAAKVIMIFGVIGSCRCNELSELNVNDIEDMGNGIVVNILNQRRKTMRSFTIVGDFYLNLYKRYCALRPLRINTSRFFLNYKEGVCQQSVMEVCKISRVPKQVASYLKLPNPSEYTGHSMRRTALTILMKKRCRTVGGFSGWLTATKRNQ